MELQRGLNSTIAKTNMMPPANPCVATCAELTRRQLTGRGAPVSRGNAARVSRDRVPFVHPDRKVLPLLLNLRVNRIASSMRLRATLILCLSRCASPITLASRKLTTCAGWRRISPVVCRAQITESGKGLQLRPVWRPPRWHGRSRAKGMAPGCKYASNAHRTGPSAVAHGLRALAGRPLVNIVNAKGAAPVDVAVAARAVHRPLHLSRAPSRTTWPTTTATSGRCLARPSTAMRGQPKKSPRELGRSWSRRVTLPRTAPISHLVAVAFVANDGWVNGACHGGYVVAVPVPALTARDTHAQTVTRRLSSGPRWPNPGVTTPVGVTTRD